MWQLCPNFKGLTWAVIQYRRLNRDKNYLQLLAHYVLFYFLNYIAWITTSSSTWLCVHSGSTVPYSASSAFSGAAETPCAAWRQSSLLHIPVRLQTQTEGTLPSRCQSLLRRRPEREGETETPWKLVGKPGSLWCEQQNNVISLHQGLFSRLSLRKCLSVFHPTLQILGRAVKVTCPPAPGPCSISLSIAHLLK